MSSARRGMAPYFSGLGVGFLSLTGMGVLSLPLAAPSLRLLPSLPLSATGGGGSSGPESQLTQPRPMTSAATPTAARPTTARIPQPTSASTLAPLPRRRIDGG